MISRKMLHVISAIALIMFCGYVGYTSNYVEPASASNTPVIPRFTDVPRGETNFSIDLNKGSLSVQSTSDEKIKVNVSQNDRIIYKTSVVEKPVPYIIRELPPVKPKKQLFVSLIEDTGLEKINLDRQ